MPWIIRIWLGFSRLFAPLLHALARRSHRKLGLPDTSLPQRLGQASAPRPEGRLIWLHAASMGEVGQTAQLIAQLQKQHGAHVLVTTMTASGADWVATHLPEVTHQFVPVDTPSAVRGFLDHWAPDMAVFVEADLWPRLVLETSARDIPLALVNARPSKSRTRAPKSFGYLLSQFTAITCKSEQVLAGIRALGVDTETLHHFGDLRASVPTLPVDPEAIAPLQSVTTNRPLWIAASSHAGDEPAILRAHSDVLQAYPDALLIWAPRHPDRAKHIMDAAAGMTVSQRSKADPVTKQTHIYLADTLGELGTWFTLGDIVFLGGSFGDEGGHNPYEPACFGCFILTGPHVQNHRDAFEAFAQIGAAQTVADGSELGAKVVALIAADDAATQGAEARNLVQASGDAVGRTVEILGATLRGPVQ